MSELLLNPNIVQKNSIIEVRHQDYSNYLQINQHKLIFDDQECNLICF